METITIPRDLYEANMAIVKECGEMLRESKAVMLDLQTEIRRLNSLAEEERPDPLYNCKQAAKYLKKDPSTISRMIADGRLEKVERGGSAGILKSELDKVKKLKKP